jgi:hypothetical protein
LQEEAVEVIVMVEVEEEQEDIEIHFQQKLQEVVEVQKQVQIFLLEQFIQLQ